VGWVTARSQATGACGKALTGLAFSAIVNLRERQNLLEIPQKMAFLSKTEYRVMSAKKGPRITKHLHTNEPFMDRRL
jgi:hypothetical protein